jgi:predicted Zn finger-like uncharacterized protein
LIVQCPQCGKQYRLDESYRERAGLVIKCPNCENRFGLAESEAITSGETRKEKPSVPSPGGKILLADDSQFFRSMVGDILSGEGYEIAFAEDGEEALNMLHSYAPDLLILDLHLPKISGFDVIKEIRRGKVKSDVPILVMSSVYTESSHVMTLDTLGANQFIDKKFKPAYLLEKVRKLIEK